MNATRDIVEVLDHDGHEYLIPVDQVSEFNKVVNKIRNMSVFTDEYYDMCEVLWNRFGKYSTQGA